MQPVSPVIPTLGEGLQTTFAKDQPEYIPLPALCTEFAVMSRWKLTDEERKHLADGGDLFIIQMNFSKPLQPVMPFVGTDDEAKEQLIHTVV